MTQAVKSGSAVIERDVIVVGAGMAGVYLLHKLRQQGFSALALEAGSGIGGTWFFNTYPGCRCDIESLEYQYRFDEDVQRGWTWSEKFATQGEILRYLEYVADRLDLRKDIALNSRVTSAIFDEDADKWDVHTTDGRHYRGRYFVAATGSLSAARVPEFEGRDSFKGRTFHTGQWPAEGVDFTGRKVAVIGTGSSGIQLIPLVAQQAAQLTVFQRTPNFSFPAGNRPLGQEEVAHVRDNFGALRETALCSSAASHKVVGTQSILDVSLEEAHRALEDSWNGNGPRLLSCFNDVMVNSAANDIVADFVRGKIRQIVKDPDLAERLIPHGYPIGAKRPCLDSGYYDCFNRDNVSLIDVGDSPIERLTPRGIMVDGVEHEFDDIVFATGFDAMTGALSRIDIRGRNGVSLKDHWSAGPKTYLGLQSAGFPNMFMVAGAGTPSVLAVVLMVIEENVDWIVRCLAHLRATGQEVIEPTTDAEARWGRHVNEAAEATLFPRATNSWYLGANVPGKPLVFMPYAGGFDTYREICANVEAKGYAGFMLSVTSRELDGEPLAVGSAA